MMKRKTQTLKAVLSLLMCAVTVSACVVCAFASTSGATVLYLDKGNIIIGDGSLQGYDIAGELVTQANADGYIIRQSPSAETTPNSIIVSSGTHTVEIDGISVSTSTMFAGAFTVGGTANVTLVLSENNRLCPGAYRAALEVESTATLSITGNGSLEAISGYDAGIGGGNGGDNGTVIINSGIITATGGSSGSGAGIGGGSSGNGGTVVINGGNVTATGGNKSAGIGGGVGGSGGNITVNGGIVKAVGGKYGAGIGGGHGAAPGEIVINGGSVKATGTDGGRNVGGGYRYTGASNVPLNSSGELLYPCFVDLEINSPLRLVAVDELQNDFYITGDCGSELMLYLWLPEGNHMVTLKHTGALPYYRLASSSSLGSLCDRVVPYTVSSDVQLTAEGTLIGIPPLTSDFTGIISPKEDASLSTNGVGSFIGTGTKAELSYGGKIFDSFTAVVYGDVDGDGFYNEQDAAITRQIISGEITAEDIGEAAVMAADADRDGVVDEKDAELLSAAGELLDTIPADDYGVSDAWKIYLNAIDSSADNSRDEQITVTAQEGYNSSVGLGKGETLEAFADYDIAGVEAPVEWLSGNPEVADISENGVITANKAGFVKIIARDSFGREGHFFVRVIDNSPRVLIFSQSGTLNVKINWWKKYSSATAKLGFLTENCGNAIRYEWSSSNSKVKIDDNGFITNTGAFSRSSRITLTAYDEFENVVASGSVQVRFFKFSWQRVAL